MDILNFISWIRGNRIVTSVDSAKTLIPVGLKDTRRDDEYLAGAIRVEDLAAQIAPASAYKVYTALLTQSGTDAPIATVLENTIGDVNLWYSGIGSYSLLTNDLFIQGKTFVIMTPLIDNGSYSSNTVFYIIQSELNEITVNCEVNGVPTDGLMENLSIEIRVYN